MIERGVDVSYETVRRWVAKFGSTYAKRIKSRSVSPSPVWHLDEVHSKINGKMVCLWRAVDDEGTVLDIVVQHRRNTKAALRLLRKLQKNQGIKPTKILTNRLRSYGEALNDLGIKHLQDVGGRKDNRTECSHISIVRREQKSQRFRSVHQDQKLLSAHAQIYNLFKHRRHLISRKTLHKFRHQANLGSEPIGAILLTGLTFDVFDYPFAGCLSCLSHSSVHKDENEPKVSLSLDPNLGHRR